MASLPEHPVSIAKVLDTGVKLFAENFIKIVPLAILGSIISTFLTIRYISNIPQQGSSTPEEMQDFVANLPGFGIAMAFMMLFGMLILGSIIFRIGNTANGQQDSLAQALIVGAKKSIPLFIALILYVLAFMLGSILLIIPGIYVLLSLSFFTYFMVNENLGIFSALKQSHKLIRGHWWRTMTVYLAPTLIMLAVIVGATIIAGATGNMKPNGQISDMFNIINGAIYALLYPFLYCIGYAQFHDLKLRKSGSDLEARLQAQNESA